MLLFLKLSNFSFNRLHCSNHLCGSSTKLHSFSLSIAQTKPWILYWLFFPYPPASFLSWLGEEHQNLPLGSLGIPIIGQSLVFLEPWEPHCRTIASLKKKKNLWSSNFSLFGTPIIDSSDSLIILESSKVDPSRFENQLSKWVCQNWNPCCNSLSSQTIHYHWICLEASMFRQFFQ